MRRPVVKYISLTLCGVLLLYLIAASAIAVMGLQDYVSASADMIVVPGNTVHANGSLSRRLKSRLDVAVELFHEGRAPLIYVSGGRGREGRDEAAAMASYLRTQGVAESAIVQDPLGITTGATGANAAQYLRSQNLGSAIVATQYFHVPRTVLALERNGVRVTGTRHARYYEMRDIYSLCREVVAYAAYFAKATPTEVSSFPQGRPKGILDRLGPRIAGHDAVAWQHLLGLYGGNPLLGADDRRKVGFEYDAEDAVNLLGTGAASGIGIGNRAGGVRQVFYVQAQVACLQNG